jgi:hypothetical protein
MGLACLFPVKAGAPFLAASLPQHARKNIIRLFFGPKFGDWYLQGAISSSHKRSLYVGYFRYRLITWVY